MSARQRRNLHSTSVRLPPYIVDDPSLSFLLSFSFCLSLFPLSLIIISFLIHLLFNSRILCFCLGFFFRRHSPRLLATVLYFCSRRSGKAANKNGNFCGTDKIDDVLDTRQSSGSFAFDLAVSACIRCREIDLLPSKCRREMCR